MTKLLLVEDNPFIMEINKEALSMYGYETVCAKDLKTAQKQLDFHNIDLIILDIMLPDGNGIDWCKKIRPFYKTPIIFLSALGENQDIIEGLRAGGDDYLPKPYDIQVLVARIEARLRITKEQLRYISFRDLSLDTISATGYLKGEDLLLTQKEFLILLMLCKNPEKVFSKEEIYKNVWGTELSMESSALWTLMSRLKKKINREDSNVTIASQRPLGYSLERQ